MGNKPSKKSVDFLSCCDLRCNANSLTSYTLEFQFWCLTEEHLKVLTKCLKVQNLADVVKIIQEYLIQNNISDYNCQSLIHDSLYKTKLCNQIYNKYCQESKNELRVVIFGDEGVGKSSITIRYVTGSFITYYDPTIEDSYRKIAPINQGSKGGIALDIFDTARREEFASVGDLWIERGEFFIIVYSIDRRETFENAINKYLFDVLRVKKDEMDKIGIIIVANKIDLRDKKNDKFVTTEEGIKIAMEYKIPYIETSAKYSININYLFNSSIFEFMYQTKVPKKKRVCNVKL